MNYRVDMSGHIAQQLAGLRERGRQIGLGQEVERVLFSIIQRLEVDPHNFGDLVDELPYLKLHVRRAFLNPISVEFGISDEHRIVYVRKVVLPMA